MRKKQNTEPFVEFVFGSIPPFIVYIYAFLHDVLICLFMQLSLKTEREKNREMYFPMRKYAIKV